MILSLASIPIPTSIFHEITLKTDSFNTRYYLSKCNNIWLILQTLNQEDEVFPFNVFPLHSSLQTYRELPRIAYSNLYFPYILNYNPGYQPVCQVYLALFDFELQGLLWPTLLRFSAYLILQDYCLLIAVQVDHRIDSGRMMHRQSNF